MSCAGCLCFFFFLQDVMPQLVNISMIFVVTFVVFPGVAASWAPQLEFFTSKGREAAGSGENLWHRVLKEIGFCSSGYFRSIIDLLYSPMVFFWGASVNVLLSLAFQVVLKSEKICMHQHMHASTRTCLV